MKLPVDATVFRSLHIHRQRPKFCTEKCIESAILRNASKDPHPKYFFRRHYFNLIYTFALRLITFRYFHANFSLPHSLLRYTIWLFVCHEIMSCRYYRAAVHRPMKLFRNRMKWKCRWKGKEAVARTATIVTTNTTVQMSALRGNLFLFMKFEFRTLSVYAVALTSTMSTRTRRDSLYSRCGVPQFAVHEWMAKGFSHIHAEQMNECGVCVPRVFM